MSNSVAAQYSALDNGVTTIKLLHSIMSLRDTVFTANDIKTNFVHSITNHPRFKFCALDQWRIRSESYLLIMTLSRMYTDDRILDDSTKPTPGVVCDHSPRATQETQASTNINVPALLNCSFLSASIDAGDIIDYKIDVDKIAVSEIVRRAVVTEIRLESDQLTHTIMLNNGDRLVHSLHMIRRVAMRNLLTGESMWNPIREWRELGSFHLHPTVDAADEDPTSTDPDLLQAEYERDRSQAKAKRRRTKSNQEKDRQLHSFSIGRLLHWDEDCKIPDELLFLNSLYRTCLELGKIAIFYNLIKCVNRSSYLAQKKNIERDVIKKRNRATTLALKVAFPFMFFTSYMSKAGNTEYMTGSAQQPQTMSTKELKRIEATCKFELNNSHIKIQMCSECRENHMNTIGASSYDPDKPYTCKSCKSLKPGFYEEMRLQPVWFERIPHATSWEDYKLDEEGKKITRYDIPTELASLTVSEQLLIRKSAPFIPSVHLTNGFYALTGQCVAFPQDISHMCTDLPRQRQEVITFIRQLGNSTTTSVHLQHLKVRKKKVMEALKWLRIHHSGYRDVTINESNLDWMDNRSEATVVENVRLIKVAGNPSDASQKASVSSIQCMDTSTDGTTLDYVTISSGKCDTGVDPEQAEMMTELIDTAKTTNQTDKLLFFPPSGDKPIRSVLFSCYSIILRASARIYYLRSNQPFKEICPQILVCRSSEYDPNIKLFSIAYPWLFPGGLGDVYDDTRGGLDQINGPIDNMKSWAKHLLRYHDNRFQSCQLFSLYVFNTIQRQENNKKGSYYHSDKGWYGKNPPTLEDLKTQIRNGDFTFISKLRYYTQSLRGTDGYWRNKTNELRSWIDYHVSRGHGPPTHFITLSCAENWWPDLRDLYATLAKNAGLTEESELILSGNFRAMSRAARKYSLYVNEYFMKRAKNFLDEFARETIELEYYWGRIEFAPGRGAIHLHLLGIARNKAYLNDFYKAKSEKDKVQVLQEYAEDYLGLTADVAIDSSHSRFSSEDKASSNTNTSPLGARFCECSDRTIDHIHLSQDAMQHSCNEYCLGSVDKAGVKLRTCRFGFGTEVTSNKGDTQGKDIRTGAAIVKDRRGIEHLLLPRIQSRKTTQHSRTVLQAWRANADVQLLIYRSNPDMPDVGEIEAVSKYCTKYAGKVHQSIKEERQVVQDVITG